MISLLLVWLRAAGLVGQSLALGGAAFTLVVLNSSRERCPPSARDRVLALTILGALMAAAAQAGMLAALGAALADDRGWPIADVLGSTAGIGGLFRITAAIGGVGAALALRAKDAAARRAVLLGAAALLALTGALGGHAMGRVESRVWLVVVSALHQAAAGIWIGGLICAAVVAARARSHSTEDWLRPFSTLAVVAVVVLAVTGALLSLEYIAGTGAAIGTTYGAMVLAKVALFAALGAMGGINYRALRAPAPSRSAVLPRRLEAEAGLAVVTVMLAASIGSAPPAVDVTSERATLAEIRSVLTPGWPRLSAPSLAELASAAGLGDPAVPRTPEDTAWSEFGHHVAGLFIVAMGLLAMLERTGRTRWARHWPLLLVVLTGFVAWSLDPEGWQTGRVGFWAQLLSVEVLQHRILLVLCALLGFAEWRVHSGRRPDSRWRYAFPVVCIVAGSLLLSHAHEVSNAKSAFLMELAHLPLALVILVAGWARWLELRLPESDGRGPGRLWAPALVLFGLILVFYREG